MVLADDGNLPPLAATGAAGGLRGQWGPLYGTWHVDPSPLMAWKSAAVVGLLEIKSEEAFRKAIQHVVVQAGQAVQQQGVVGGVQSAGMGGVVLWGWCCGRGVVMGMGVEKYVCGVNPWMMVAFVMRHPSQPLLSSPPLTPPLTPSSHPPISLGKSDPRVLAAKSFVQDVGRGGGWKKEVQHFMERWVYGQGCPRIQAAFRFDKYDIVALLLCCEIVVFMWEWWWLCL